MLVRKSLFILIPLMMVEPLLGATPSSCLPLTPEILQSSGPYLNEDLHKLYKAEISELTNAGLSQLSPEIKTRNEAALQSFSPQKNSGVYVSKLQAQSILAQIKNHPVVGEKAAEIFDPEEKVGFCFGRAAYVHMELLRRGVPAESIVKIFLVGSLVREKVIWQYHVATAVRGANNKWWVIDSLAPQVMEVKEWMKFVSQWDGNPDDPRNRFYFTAPSKFQTQAGGYDERLSLPLYNDYFTEMMKWFSADKKCSGFQLTKKINSSPKQPN